MALRQLMLEKELKEKRSRMEALGQKDFSVREKEIEAAIEEAATDEDKALVEDAISAFELEKEQHEKEKADLEQRIGEIENEIAELERKQEIPKKKEGEEPKMRTRTLDTVAIDKRDRIMKAPETTEFLERVTTAMKEKRAITGAGLSIPAVMLDLIRENVFRYSKLINRVHLRTITGDARQNIAGTVPEAVWTEMCGKLNELSFGFNQVTIDGWKVAGYIPICNSILQDSAYDLAAEIIDVLGQAIGYALDKAVLYGKGAASKMPLGIVTRLAQTTKPEGYPDDAPAWKNLSTSNIIKMAAATGAEFYSQFVLNASKASNSYARGEKFWAMNSNTYAMLLSKALVIDASGAIVASVNGTMPVVGGNIDVLEFIPDGDIIGGYGDLYLLGERRGIQIDQSEHVQFIEDNTVFRARARYDGMPVIPESFVAININNVNVTTTMDFAPDSANP